MGTWFDFQFQFQFQLRLSLRLLLIRVAAVASCAAWAQMVADAPVQVVQVAGLANPDRQPYRRLLGGMDAFEKHHALAPSAVLRYRLYTRLPEVQTKGVRGRLQSGAGTLALALADDLSFTLPRDL